MLCKERGETSQKTVRKGLAVNAVVFSRNDGENANADVNKSAEMSAAARTIRSTRDVNRANIGGVFGASYEVSPRMNPRGEMLLTISSPL